MSNTTHEDGATRALGSGMHLQLSHSLRICIAHVPVIKFSRHI
jgi:hypothetical protein